LKHQYYTRDGKSVIAVPICGSSEMYQFVTGGVAMRCAFCGANTSSHKVALEFWDKEKTVFFFCLSPHAENVASSYCRDRWREALYQQIEYERDDDPTHLPFPISHPVRRRPS